MVVLPAPFGPMIVKTCPCSTVKETPSTARMPPKLMTSPSAAKNVIRSREGPRHGPPHPPTLGARRETRHAPRSRAPSSQALRAHVRPLAAKRRVLVEREEREVDLDLAPAAVDA